MYVKRCLEAGLAFEWDPLKARANLTKHGVSFDLAQRVWSDPLHVIVLDRIEDGEARWHALGQVGAIVLLVVVHAYPDPADEHRVRIIGARKATRLERKRYEDQDL
jgi:uncharacterized DUF497 family protein